MRRFPSLALALVLVGANIGAQTASSTSTKRTTTGTSTSARSTRPRAATRTPPPLVTDEQKTIYALGLSIYNNISQFDLSPAELDIVKRAMTDAAAKKPAEELPVWGPKISGLAQARSARVSERQKAESDAYLAKAAAQPGAVKTTSGMIYREIRPGSGNPPATADTVKVNYKGTLVDGSVFDSSYARNTPAEFPLSHVIPCWTEGLQLMKPGGKAQLVCPSNLAYGEHPPPGMPPGATLTFEVELLSVTPGPK